MPLPDPVRSRALLLGSSRYTDPDLPDLPAVLNNVEDLANVLRSPWGTALSDRHCVPRVDEETLPAVGARLVEAAAEAEDLLLVYYAGHGLVGPDGELYLSLPGTSSDPSLIAWTGVPFGLVRRTLATARAASRVLVLDCCFSGQAIDLMAADTSVVSGQLAVSGTCTLASSPANRPSHAPSAARYTAYTGELLDLLHRGSEDAAEFLTLLGIHEHLARALPAKGHPRPEQRNTRTVGRLALARNRAYTDTVDPAAMVKEGTRLERIGELGDAAHWYRLAAEAGHTDGMLRLARLLSLRGDGIQAGLWRRRAAESGDPATMNALGVQAWHTGDLPQAEEWFRQAADAGFAEARDNLRTLLRQRGRSA
ncbi:caspase family protein [Streptomyces sp. NBC_00249]|uniref:caspase, EACC1-associated type n=1 Tax=Streptomyces sp. NBC_00249 TaxID=2975690 RepID=UPI00225414B7|nr:caspase family protein [Streptomyces sp. NBC_00249]MCX5194701.1 caspase family protein [Streptomyces sp. NBC_00249]